MKMISVICFCDSTDLFTEEEIMQENLCDLDFPELIVRAWYVLNKKVLDSKTAHWLGVPEEQCTFDLWLKEASTAMDTDGLYDFAIAHGFRATR